MTPSKRKGKKAATKEITELLSKEASQSDDGEQLSVRIVEFNGLSSAMRDDLLAKSANIEKR